MVPKREQFNLERIATKNTVKVLRFLTSKPYLAFGLTELSEYLKISKSYLIYRIEKPKKNKEGRITGKRGE